ncbi:hypothetical protein VT03_28175 [Planctomyces sp. SH-PL14]|nr:hypothetical protein VT03_28175 [Planctomyces sp. SH-PL14]
MPELVVNEATWYWLARLRIVPMRVASGVDEVGADVVATLVRSKLVKSVQGHHVLTELGVRLVDSPPRPMANGDRVVMR